jgi:hypothetical protein
MVELIKYLITSITNLPDQVNISQSVDSTGVSIVRITVAPEDMGRVIGKNGRIISAIRELAKVKAIKQGKKVRLILEEQTNPSSQSEPTAEL